MYASLKDTGRMAVMLDTGAKEDVLPLEEAVVLLKEAEEERAEADRALDAVLGTLGLGGWRHG
jgi:type I restriction enzyme M protein